ncbi:MAG: hypothetical protein LBK68_00285, partial [Candidatus Margulisbacteria bacterium]|nr:hypothetical protein [Candidatus Margulisiibacteriota bacterium]
FSDALRSSKAYPAIPAWGQMETVVLTRDFGLMWDEVVRSHGDYGLTQLRNRLDIIQREMDVILTEAAKQWQKRGR